MVDPTNTNPLFLRSLLNTPDIPVPNPPCTVNALWNVPLNKAYEQSYKYCIPFWKGTADGQKYTAKIIDTCSRFRSIVAVPVGSVYYDVVVLNPYADLKILSLQRFIQFKNSRGFHIKSD
jgi:hypothetical protein